MPSLSTSSPPAAAGDNITDLFMDRETFSQHVREHHRQLIAYATALCNGESERARDIVQEAFVTAFKNLGKFDVSRDFGAWMRGIVRNKWREDLRKKKAIPMEDEVLEALEEQHQNWSPFAASASADLFKALSECLSRLPDTLRQAVDSFYFKELSGAESAEELGSSPASVRKRLQRARGQLKDCLHLKAASLS